MQNDANNGSLTDKFRDFGAAPSDGLWDSIAAQLEEKKKRRFGFWWWTAGLAATLLIAAGVYFYGTDAQSHTSSYARTHAEGKGLHPKRSLTDTRQQDPTVIKGGLQSAYPTENTALTHPTKQQSGSPAKSRINSSDRQAGRQAVSNENHGRSVTTNLSNNGINRIDGPVVADNGTDPLRNLTENDRIQAADSLRAVPTEVPPSDNDVASHSDSIRDDSSFGRLPDFTHIDAFTVMPPKKWMVGVHVSRWQDDGREPWMTTSSPGEMSATSADILGTPGTNGPYIHRHWSLEAEVAYRFRPRLWLESGIHAGYFTSDRKTVSAAYTNAKLTAWTIGVPIHLNVDIVSLGRWQVYTGLGINLDFPLQRKLQYAPGNSAAAFSIEESTSPNGYLGSTQLNLGVRYCVWKNLSVDLRPAVRRYFEGGAPNGVYVYNRWWWGVAGGVTYQF